MVESAGERMERLRGQAMACMDCALSRTRKHVVFGEGDPEADIVFVGEGPGQWEDLSGRPFVGRAGKLLDEVLRENGIRRQEVYICNVIKCRASVERMGKIKNRPPRVGEVRACKKWLDGQLTIIQPKVLLCVGGPAASLLIHKNFKMTQERGVWFPMMGYAPFRLRSRQAFAMAVLHPAYVLRQEGEAFEKARRGLVEDIAEAKRKAEEIVHGEMNHRKAKSRKAENLFFSHEDR